MNKKVLYTCIVGKVDNYPEIEEIPKGWDLKCFTSEDLKPNKTWETVKIKREYLNQKDCRNIKVNAHKHLEDYDHSVWIDANVKLLKGWSKIADQCFKESNMVFLCHPERVRGPYAEASRCLSLKKDVHKRIDPQVAFYQKEGLPSFYPLSATGILIRNHNNIKEFLDVWWEQIRKYSYRDQISLCYAKWKTGIVYSELKFVRKKPEWFVLKPHRFRR